MLKNLDPPLHFLPLLNELKKSIQDANTPDNECLLLQVDLMLGMRCSICELDYHWAANCWINAMLYERSVTNPDTYAAYLRYREKLKMKKNVSEVKLGFVSKMRMGVGNGRTLELSSGAKRRKKEISKKMASSLTDFNN